MPGSRLGGHSSDALDCCQKKLTVILLGMIRFSRMTVAGGRPLAAWNDGGAAPLICFFLFVPHPQKPLTRPNSRSTLNFDRSLRNAQQLK
jgi:hypothetical protein